jgi:hypothetical protein
MQKHVPKYSEFNNDFSKIIFTYHFSYDIVNAVEDDGNFKENFKPFKISYPI